ncbi:MAG: MBL fold metallo-hydrolase [Bacillota bacterium]|nr:MBL fold metallo-hydrolase [Bacillota bacterium]
MKIKFCGGVQSVTGSCHLLSIGSKRLLLDCGQFQGNKTMEKLNYEDFGFSPSEVDFMILSHAHIDHCGRVPLLVKKGFKGKIFCTDATYDLVEIMLRDGAYIHEKEAEWQNRKNERAGKPPVEPLYTVKDAEESLQYFEPLVYGETRQLCDEIKIKFSDAGHILGSAITEIWAVENGKTTKIVFSGDLGMKNRPILRDPETIETADVVIMETTYGNRVHPENVRSIEALVDIILTTTARGGNVVIPAFAVGRTQELLYDLNRFYETSSPDYKSALSNIKVYVDSPMATNATAVFRKNAQVFDDETKEYILKGDHPLDFPNLVFTKTSDESQALNFNHEPKVIISASGMCEAGRIKHHLKHNIWSEKNTVVFVGYQAEGTLGKRIVDGEKYITLFGEQIYVNAEIRNLEGMSGHADRDSLLDWLNGFEKQPSQIFLVHGEADSKNDFAALVKEKLGYDTIPVNEVGEYDITVSPSVQDAPAPSVHDAPQTADPAASAEPINKEPAAKTMATREEVIEMREKMYKLHEDFEHLLYNASLAVDGERMSFDKAEEINNILLNLQKGIVNLGSDVLLDE